MKVGDAAWVAGRPPAVLVGSSHLVCLGVPLRSADGSVDLLAVEESEGSFLYLNGPFPRDDAYWAEAERLAEFHKLFICWRGNQHMAAFLLASDCVFDFILSAQPDLAVVEGAHLVPELMLVETFAPSMHQLEDMLSRIGRTGRGIVLCGTPPPKDSVRVIRAGLANEAHFVERLAALGTSPELVAITPPLVLYKMWRLIQRMLREIADRHAIPFVATPAQAVAPNGFLREAYWSSDVTHANRDFGRLLLASYREHV